MTVILNGSRYFNRSLVPMILVMEMLYMSVVCGACVKSLHITYNRNLFHD